MTKPPSIWSRPGLPARPDPAKPPAKPSGQSVQAFQTGVLRTGDAARRVGSDLVAEAMLNRNLVWARDSRATWVSLLLDKSGSMLVNKPVVIESYNDYLGGLRLYQNVAYSFYQFDSHELLTVYESYPVQHVPFLTPDGYQPLGGTPLYDRIIEVIRRREELTKDWPHQPPTVICIQTDGEDTSNKSSAEVKALIKKKLAEGWQFQFLGAGIDIYSLAETIGVPPENAMAYNPTDRQATKLAFKTVADRQLDFAKGKTKTAAFTPEDRKRVKDTRAPPRLLLR